MPIPQIVIDTNVIISGLRSQKGSSFQLLKLIGMDYFNIHLSVPLVLEYESILLREIPKLITNETEIRDLIDYYCLVGIHHQIFFLWRPYLPDPKDDMVLELAVTAQCDSIVTYNSRDFRGIDKFGLTTISPASFLKKIGVL